MTKEIHLTQGKVAVVDDEDYEELMKWRWCAEQHSVSCYAKRGIQCGSKRGTMYMHTQIAGYKFTDHINGNGLDNRRCNIRACTRQQNNMNRRAGRNNRSGYKGVYFRKSSRTFLAQIDINKRSVHLGSFSSAIEAARAYNEAAIKYYGEFALLNNV